MVKHVYPDLHGGHGWPLGVHRAPAGYEHKWLVVHDHLTRGYNSRREARDHWRRNGPHPTIHVAGPKPGEVRNLGWEYDVCGYEWPELQG